MLRSVTGALLLGCAASAPAQIASEPSYVARLSPAEREAALEEGAARASRELPINGLSRGVHGEIGMEIGTGGTRALYGTAIVPLGDMGAAAFSFLTDRAGGQHPR